MPGFGKSGISRIFARRSSADTDFGYLSWGAQWGRILGAVSLAQGRPQIGRRTRRRAVLTSSAMEQSGADFFGREFEFQTIAAFTDANERVGALILEGEPGIGKTTLWRAGLAEARNKGINVVASSPASGETQLAFSVLSDLLATALRTVGVQ